MLEEIYCKTCSWRGGFGDLARVQEQGKWICICPVCGRAEIYCARRTFGKILTTNEKTSEVSQYRKWLKFYPTRTVRGTDDLVWVFTDGSSTGSSAAVVLAPGKGPVELVRHMAQPANRNVGAEIMAVALGLKHVPDESFVMVVSDYLGTAGWLNGHWKLSDAAAVPRLGVIRHLIRTKGLMMVRFIHHKGHQKDPSDFTRWNSRCDTLCSVKARKEALGE